MVGPLLPGLMDWILVFKNKNVFISSLANQRASGSILVIQSLLCFPFRTYCIRLCTYGTMTLRYIRHQRVIVANAAGLSVGKEGPLIHITCAIADTLMATDAFRTVGVFLCAYQIWQGGEGKCFFYVACVLHSMFMEFLSINFFVLGRRRSHIRLRSLVLSRQAPVECSLPWTGSRTVPWNFPCVIRFALHPGTLEHDEEAGGPGVRVCRGVSRENVMRNLVCYGNVVCYGFICTRKRCF